MQTHQIMYLNSSSTVQQFTVTEASHAMMMKHSVIYRGGGKLDLLEDKKKRTAK